MLNFFMYSSGMYVAGRLEKAGVRPAQGCCPLPSRPLCTICPPERHLTGFAAMLPLQKESWTIG